MFLDFFQDWSLEQSDKTAEFIILSEQVRSVVGLEIDWVKFSPLNKFQSCDEEQNKLLIFMKS